MNRAPRLVSPIEWRLSIAFGIEFAALLYLPRMAVWRGLEREIWQLFAMGIAGAIALALALPVAFQGTPLQRLGSTLLSVFPMLILWGVGVGILDLRSRL